MISGVLPRSGPLNCSRRVCRESANATANSGNSRPLRSEGGPPAHLGRRPLDRRYVSHAWADTCKKWPLIYGMGEPVSKPEHDGGAVEPEEGRSHEGCGVCANGAASSSRVEGHGVGENTYPTTAVRFGYMRYIGEFSHPPDLKYTCNAKLIIQTKRGIEMGEQVPFTCEGCEQAATREQTQQWVKASGQDSFLFGAGRILREATSADLADYARIQGGCKEKRDFCQQLAERRNLPLRIVECECPFGGERIIYYFTAAERVDFRGLVKDLAREYRTRIEMRQVGARDEARLLADYETCGREVCCKTFLKTLKPVSMRMAKVQKSTLDPAQVSGRCGRLKCCLRYEHLGYEELDKRLPRVGVRIRTSYNEGVVVNRQILTQLVQIHLDGENLLTVAAEDILEADVPEPSSQSSPSEPLTPPAPSVPRPTQGPKTKPSTRPVESRPDPLKGNREPSASPHSRGPGSPRTVPAAAKTGQAQSQGSRRRRRRGRRRRPRKEGGPKGQPSGPDDG